MTDDTIIYDDQCPLCNHAVKFLKGGEGGPGFRFYPSSGKESQKVMDEYGIAHEEADKTVILVHDRKIFTKSSAIIKALQNKGGFWKLAGILRLVPAFVRDKMYDFVASHR